MEKGTVQKEKQSAQKDNEAKEKEQKLPNSLITEESIGRDVMIFLINNQMELGKISAVSKYEIEVTRRDGTKKIVFKSAIISLEFKS